nr:(Fe-S)-binding protein [Bacillus marinisedimentorum]
MNEDELLNCMRCGFCLPSCPTYIESGYDEAHSPRGRIAVMRALVDGKIEPDEDVEKSLDLCLGCRACETVCPSGVNYGQLLEQARDIINQNKTFSVPVKTLRNVVFNQLFPYQNRMRAFSGLLSFYQHSGVQKLAQKTGILNILPDNLSTMEKVLPKVPSYRKLKDRPEHLPALAPQKKKVAFFTGCLMDTIFIETNNRTMKLLQLAGSEVVIPNTQNCCGALHGHSGEKDKSKELAKRNIAAFEQTDADYIVTNAGGCGAFLVDYDHLLAGDPEWAERAERFAGKIRDISNVLMELGFFEKELKIDRQIVTYQDSCHLRNVQKTFAEPRALIQAINGAEYVEMEKADSCCGSAGIYNIVNEEMSMKILDRKMINTKATKAKTVVTANPGCLLQMKLGIEREGLKDEMRAVHIVDLLIEAVEGSNSEATVS